MQVKEEALRVTRAARETFSDEQKKVVQAMVALYSPSIDFPLLKSPPEGCVDVGRLLNTFITSGEAYML